MIIKALATMALSTAATAVMAADEIDNNNNNNNVKIIEHDILTHASHEGSMAFGNKHMRGLASSAISLCPKGVIPYTLHDNLTPSAKQAVQDAVNHWNAVGSISLVPVEQNVFTDHGDYLEFVDGPSCASWVGRQGGAQEVWVSDLCSKGSMIHEIGHAIGLLHEHTRADRDQHIKINWDNIESDRHYNFEVNQSFDKAIGPYDYNSIMHYGEFYFSSNGQPTIETINAPEGTIIGQRESTSQGDISAVNTLYQTDLALAANWVSGVGSNEIKLHVTNQGSMGAHSIVIDIEGDYQLVESSSTTNWQCAAALTFDGIRCYTPELTSSATSNVTLTFGQALDAERFNPKLSSKTFDNNAANNALQILNTEEPDTGEAQKSPGDPAAGQPGTGGTTTNGTGGSGGGGVLGMMSIFLLAMRAKRRRLAAEAAKAQLSE